MISEGPSSKVRYITPAELSGRLMMSICRMVKMVAEMLES